ncbi:FtsX-like permease family protein [Actinomadura sp. HBU206391]|uniref:FtsX-like permease family protein n=1 Tax=Actinomadura sp. HBU206391 TaxID=2731692 RepID=UPI00164FA10E|nr:ABC transporter permease [Actinomadura sp. HBU206391]MBC6461940.1 ABC transporter permease [Actinomadura sp. HBU206391]
MIGVGLVLRRAFSERTLILAATVTALFATTVLAALTTFTGSVTREGLRRTLAAATFESAGTRITAQVSAGGYENVERSLQAALHRAYADIPLTTTVSARGDSYALPGQEKLRRPELTTFAMYSGIEEHATLTAGAWPRPGTPAPADGGMASAAVEAVLPVPAARAMKAEVGDVLTLHSRLDDGAVRVRVTGLFRAGRADDYFWQGNRLVTSGVERLDYTTYGPLVVAPATFVATFGRAGFSANWLVFPDCEAITSQRLGVLGPRLDTLAADLRTGRAGHQFVMDTSLPDLVEQTSGALLVARSTMLIPVLQLIVLAGYALTLVARLIAEHRRMEVALLRARGASAGQLSMLTIGEGALLTAPGALAAPLLSGPLLTLAGTTSVVRTSGLRPDFAPSALTWVTSIAAALICALALTVPTLRGVTRSYVATRAARGRGERRGVLQRAGADLALLVVAALGVWQLTRYGGPVTATTETGTTAGVDPFIVTGPALALLAGGLLVLRLVPIASRALERFTSRGRGLAPALGARQVSRRPVRYAGPVLLLVMAVAVGVLSVAAGSTWRRSQLEQADFQAGTDLRVDVPAGDSGPLPLGRGGRFAALPSVTAVSPVLRQQATSGGQEIVLLAGDAAVMGSLLRTRPDLMDRSAPAKLTAGRSELVAAVLPGRPDRIAVDLRLSPAGGGTGTPKGVTFRAFATLVDGRGSTQEIGLGALPPDGRTRTRVIDATDLAGPGGRVTYPLTVRGVRYQVTQEPVRSGASGEDALEFGLLRIRGGTAAAWERAVPPLPGDAWTPIADANYAQAGASRTTQAPEVLSRSGTFLTMIVPRPPAGDDGTVGLGAGHAVLAAPPDRAAAGGDAGGRVTFAPIPGIITTALAGRARVGVGGTVTVGNSTGEQPIKVVAVVPALPSTAPDRPAVLVDLRTVTDRFLGVGSAAPEPGEWWVAARDGDTGPAVRALAANPDWNGAISDRAGLRRELRDAPLGAALQGALVIGFLAALAFVVIGFVVNAAVSARERVAEFAVLRALGVAPRQIVGLLGVEQAFLVALGLAGGTVLGVVVARLVVPHIVLTVRARAPYPPVDVVVSWQPVLAMLGCIALLLLGVLTVFLRSLRRDGPGAAMRAGGAGGDQ